jgi:hypothetical protein
MTGWHVDAELARRYADGATRIDLATSVEAHVMACAGCRDTLAAAVSNDRLTGIWDLIANEIGAARPRLTERVITRQRGRWATQIIGSYQQADAPTSLQALPTPSERRRELAVRYYLATHSLRSFG